MSRRLLGLREKMLAPPAIALAFLLAFGAYMIAQLHQQWATAQVLVDERAAGLDASRAAAYGLASAHAHTYRALELLRVNAAEDVLKRVIGERDARLAEATAALEARARGSGEGATRYRTAAEAVAAYAAEVRKSYEMSEVDINMGAMAMQSADAAFERAAARASELVAEETRQLAKERAASEDRFRRAIAVAIVVLALTFALSIACALYLARRLSRPMLAMLGAMERCAQGDLDVRLEAAGEDEVGRVGRAFNALVARLREMIGAIRRSADAVGTASQQIAAGNGDLSQRTEEQASSLEETASSMEELASTVKQNAENARQASQLAAGASEIAQKGGQMVAEVVATMGGISESSKKIADIIGVIDGIAFQTNILALNAAVEAARAGEQGRGFAVVASEVRSLAQRSAAAAKEIKALIGDSVDKVQHGQQVVEQAGETISELVGAVKRVTDIVGEIAAASQEQSSGIEQVNQAVSQMDQVTQQNAALVEEAAAAAESLKEQARQLVEAVGVFRLEQAAGAGAPKKEAPALVSEPRPQVRNVAKFERKAAPKAAAANEPRPACRSTEAGDKRAV